MKCIHCQGRMERGSAPFQVNRKGYQLVLETVPAWVCMQCGETYFEEHQVTEIQKVIEQVDRQTKQMAASA